MKKNTERNVSWSNTYDTFDENSGGNNNTFESLDTFETRDDNDADECGSVQEDEDKLERDFNFIYNGETDISYNQTETFDTMRSVSVSSEMDGTVEMQQMDHRPIQSKPMQPVTISQASATSSPMPPPTMAPKQEERKQFAELVSSQQQMMVDASFMRLTPPVQYNMNLACSSTLSDGTIEARKDRYEGLCRAESEDTYQNWASSTVKENRRQARMASIKPSDVFIPRQGIELQDHIIHAMASKSDSNSEDDITLDSIIDDVSNYTPSHDMNRIRAASDDESIASLTKRDHKFNLLFESQRQVDTIAGHIGLILPFLDRVKLETELMAKEVMERVTNSNGNDVRINDDSNEHPVPNAMYDTIAKRGSNECDVSNFNVDSSSNNNFSTIARDSPSKDSDESYEMSEYEEPVNTEVIRMQDLRSKQHGWARKKAASSKNENTDMSKLQQVVAMDHSAMDISEQKSNMKFQGKWLSWGRRKKCKNTNGAIVSDRFDPTLLPQANVDDDDLSCSGSCITTESILSELKVIENTAKLMYQQLCISPTGDVCTSPEYISALFSSTATELIIECSPQEEKDNALGKSKKGGKLRELLGKCIPKKKLSCGPVCGVTATWNPTLEESIDPPV